MTKPAQKAFDALKRPSGADAIFNAAHLSDDGVMRIGRSSKNSPAFLVSVTDPALDAIELRNLRAMFNAHCRIAIGSDVSDERLTIVECLSEDPDVQGLFLSAVDAAMAVIEMDASAARVRTVVLDLVELFRSLSRPARRSVVGAWGELFLISRARDPVLLVEAWHVDSSERFDFFREASRIEVKTTRDYMRKHSFSLEQLHETNSRILIASILTSDAGGGTSLRDLMNDAAARVPPSAQMKLAQGVAVSLGSDWSSAIDVRFDLGRAESSLAFFDARRVPTVPLPVPSEVSEVRFVADLTNSAELPREEVKEGGSLWEAALPARR